MCYDGDVRLVGGKHSAVGRVEVCKDNTWGTICDLGWNDLDARAACMSAGFYWGMYIHIHLLIQPLLGIHLNLMWSLGLLQFVGGEAISNTGFGVGSGPILASNIVCNGSEYSLDGCYNITNIPDVCTHARDAAAQCQPGFSAFSFHNFLMLLQYLSCCSWYERNCES